MTKPADKTNTVGRLFPDWESAHASDPQPLPERLRVMHRLHGVANGKTCGSCEHCQPQGDTAGRYLKCEESLVTRGAGTDWRARWLACGLHQPKSAH